MTKPALFGVAGLLSLCHSLFAQQTQRQEQFQLDGSALDRPSLRFPSLMLEDRERFFFSTTFGSMQSTANFLPTFNPSEPQNLAYPNLPGRRKSVDNMADLRAPAEIQFGGEIGFLYGKSSGKYGREDFGSYIIGTVGTDKFSITAGYLHQETSGRLPRWGR